MYLYFLVLRQQCNFKFLIILSTIYFIAGDIEGRRASQEYAITYGCWMNITSSVSYIKCKANMKSFHQLQMSCLVGQVVLLQQNSDVRVLDSSSSVVKKLCGPERTLDDRV